MLNRIHHINHWLTAGLNSTHTGRRRNNNTAHEYATQWKFGIYIYISLHFNGHFPAGPVSASIGMTLLRILLELRMMEVVHGDNWSYKTCKAPVKLSPPTNQHPPFYRPDALSVAQPTVLKHWSWLLLTHGEHQNGFETRTLLLHNVTYESVQLQPERLVDRSKPADKRARCKQDQVEDRETKRDSSRLWSTSLYCGDEIRQWTNNVHRQCANVCYIDRIHRISKKLVSWCFTALSAQTGHAIEE